MYYILWSNMGDPTWVKVDGEDAMQEFVSALEGIADEGEIVVLPAEAEIK